MNVYLVHGESGQYSDASWWLVAVYDSEDAAKAHADRCRNWIIEHNAADQRALDEDIYHDRWYDEAERDGEWKALHPPEDPKCSPDYDGRVQYTVTEMPLAKARAAW